MNRRQTRAGFVQSAAGVAPKIHPVTGAEILPLSFTRKDGTVSLVWPVLGAADDPDPDDDTDPDDKDPDDDTTDKKDPKPDDDDEPFEDANDDSEAVRKVKSMARRIERQSVKRHRENRQLNRELTDLRAEVDRLKSASNPGKSDDDPKDDAAAKQATKDLEDERKRNDQLAAQLRTQSIRVEFLGLQLPFTWADPSDALRLLDMDDVDIDEKGVVDRKSLRQAAKDLAKAKPHLVKAKADANDGSGSSGANAGSGGRNGRNNTGAADKQALLERAPALRGRR